MRNPLAIPVMLFLSVSTGCLYNNPYPYGYYGNGSTYGPGYYSSPQPMMPNYPSGTYPPTVNPTPLDGGTYTPGAPGNGPTLSDPPNTFKDGNNTPTFRETPTDRSVPDPGDDTSGSGAMGPNLTPTNTARNRDNLSSPFEQDDSTQAPRRVEEPYAEAEQVYEAPLLRQVNGLEEPEGLQQANRETIPESPQTPQQTAFGHHPRYEWLRGLVEYDQQAETWVMLYDDNPDHSDKLGGVVTLSDHPGLKRLQDGQSVRVQGSLDRSMTDASGKPIYRVTKVIKP